MNPLTSEIKAMGIPVSLDGEAKHIWVVEPDERGQSADEDNMAPCGRNGEASSEINQTKILENHALQFTW